MRLKLADDDRHNINSQATPQTQKTSGNCQEQPLQSLLLREYPSKLYNRNSIIIFIDFRAAICCYLLLELKKGNNKSKLIHLES